MEAGGQQDVTAASADPRVFGHGSALLFCQMLSALAGLAQVHRPHGWQELFHAQWPGTVINSGFVKNSGEQSLLWLLK